MGFRMCLVLHAVHFLGLWADAMPVAESSSAVTAGSVLNDEVDEPPLDFDEHLRSLKAFGLEEINLSGDPPQLSAPRQLQDTACKGMACLDKAISAATGDWSALVQALSSSDKTSVQSEHFGGMGWKEFKEQTKFFRGAGLPEKQWKPFLRSLRRTIGLSKKDRKDFESSMKFSFNAATWIKTGVNFKIGKGGTGSGVTVFTRHDAEKQTVDVCYVTTKKYYKLQDDFMVLTHSQSYLGGMFSKQTVEIKKKPAALSTQDIEFLTSYFELLAFQQAALAEGLASPPDPQFIGDSGGGGAGH